MESLSAKAAKSKSPQFQQWMKATSTKVKKLAEFFFPNKNSGVQK